MKISEIDPNLSVESSLSVEDLVWFNVRQDPFVVYGLYNYKNEPIFRRIPEDVARATSENVALLAAQTSGGRIRFKTNSRYLALKAVMPDLVRMPHMPALGSSGFDAYATDHGHHQYIGSFLPSFGGNGYETTINSWASEDQEMRDYVINMPLYDSVTDVYIGVSSSAEIDFGDSYQYKTPIVFYGSSITQGGCASRPGTSYAGFISRRFDTDFINLGFSGNARAEDAIVDYMATLPMSIFVSDYDHNAPDPEHLKATHFNMYQKIRAANPDLPYLMLSRPDSDRLVSDVNARREIILESYHKALASGDKNVYFIDGCTLFGNELRDECTVDGCHPNDLGFSRMANVLGDVIEKILITRSPE